MKKLLVLIMLLITISTQSQGDESIIISPEIEHYLYEIIEEAGSRDFNIKPLILKYIDVIVFYEGLSEKMNNPEVLAVSVPSYKAIYLDTKILDKPDIIIKLTIFHEVGHMVSRTTEHTCFDCNQIMAMYCPEENELELYSNKGFWNSVLDDYFNWLKNK